MKFNTDVIHVVDCEGVYEQYGFNHEICKISSSKIKLRTRCVSTLQQFPK